MAAGAVHRKALCLGEWELIMKNTGRKTALGVMTALMVAASSMALAQATAIKGMIVSNNGSSIVVQVDGVDTTVLLTDSTKIRGTSGAIGLRGESHPPSDLMRGLAVQVTANQDGGPLTATDITFKNSDLKVAQQIAAGIAATQTQVDINSQRIDDVGQLVPAGRTKVYFAVGSTTINAQGKQSLQMIANQAKALKTAYRLAVVGRADKSGNAAANQRLSDNRAAAVTAYLMESTGMSPGNFLPAAGLGSATIFDDPAPPTSPADARRVTVTIAVSKSSIVGQ
jgi:outer membrane protein OmpA-like peptidoglycan-associated protein